MKRWFRPTAIAVALFVVSFIAVRCAEADTIFEAAPGTAFVGGSHYTGLSVFMSERFQGKYDIGVVLMSEQHCNCDRGDVVGNLAVQAQRVVRWRNLELGLGASYWQNQTKAFSSNTAFALSIGYSVGHWTIRHRHYSTGGASERNGGLDLITFGYQFK